MQKVNKEVAVVVKEEVLGRFEELYSYLLTLYLDNKFQRSLTDYYEEISSFLIAKAERTKIEPRTFESYSSLIYLSGEDVFGLEYPAIGVFGGYESASRYEVTIKSQNNTTNFEFSNRRMHDTLEVPDSVYQHIKKFFFDNVLKVNTLGSKLYACDLNWKRQLLIEKGSRNMSLALYIEQKDFRKVQDRVSKLKVLSNFVKSKLPDVKNSDLLDYVNIVFLKNRSRIVLTSSFNIDSIGRLEQGQVPDETYLRYEQICEKSGYSPEVNLSELPEKLVLGNDYEEYLRLCDAAGLTSDGYVKFDTPMARISK